MNATNEVGLAMARYARDEAAMHTGAMRYYRLEGLDTRQVVRNRIDHMERGIAYQAPEYQVY